MKNVAIVQNRIVKGGRFHVIAAIVKVLNQLGIQPDVLTLKSRLDKNEINKFYGSEIKFNLKEISFDIRIPSDFHILYFNLLIHFYTKKYDLIINSSNSSFLMPADKKILSYVHYPRKDRLLSSEFSIHFPDGIKKSWLKPKHIFVNTAALLYRLNKNLVRNEVSVANSKFTKSAIDRNYLVKENDIEVIYPPVWRLKKNEEQFEKKKLMVCSIGRFSSDKRQLEQIKIAEKLPDYEFHIIGFANESDSYFNECKRYLAINKMKNVFLHPNIEFSEMESILSNSMFFLHSMRNEPFGIVTVQAIEKGCIPIVHNSGGQKEIVNEDELRYNDIDEAVEIFNKLQKNDANLISLRNKIMKNASQFSYDEFERRLKPILVKRLELENEY